MSMICLGSAQSFVRSQGHAVPVQALVLPHTLPTPQPQAGLAAASAGFTHPQCWNPERHGGTASPSSAGVAAFDGVKMT